MEQQAFSVPKQTLRLVQNTLQYNEKANKSYQDSCFFGPSSHQERLYDEQISTEDIRGRPPL